MNQNQICYTRKMKIRKIMKLYLLLYGSLCKKATASRKIESWNCGICNGIPFLRAIYGTLLHGVGQESILY